MGSAFGLTIVKHQPRTAWELQASVSAATWEGKGGLPLEWKVGRRQSVCRVSTGGHEARRYGKGAHHDATGDECRAERSYPRSRDEAETRQTPRTRAVLNWGCYLAAETL